MALALKTHGLDLEEQWPWPQTCCPQTHPSQKLTDNSNKYNSVSNTNNQQLASYLLTYLLTYKYSYHDNITRAMLHDSIYYTVHVIYSAQFCHWL